MNAPLHPIDISAIYHFLNSLKKTFAPRQFHFNDITDLLEAKKKTLAHAGNLYLSN